MVGIGAVAKAAATPGPLQTALVFLGAGALFFCVGLVQFTNFRGLAQRWARSAERSLDDISVVSRPLRRMNARLFFGGGEAAREDFALNVVPKVLGVAGMIAGSVVLIDGIVRLLPLA